jgi:hypothetical protein
LDDIAAFLSAGNRKEGLAMDADRPASSSGQPKKLPEKVQLSGPDTRTSDTMQQTGDVIHSIRSAIDAIRDTLTSQDHEVEATAT